MTVDLSKDALDALILVVDSGCSLSGPIRSDLRPPLVLEALPALRAARDRFGDKEYSIIRREYGRNGRSSPIKMSTGSYQEVRTWKARAEAERIADRLNEISKRAGRHSGMVVPQDGEVRYFVHEAAE